MCIIFVFRFPACKKRRNCSNRIQKTKSVNCGASWTAWEPVGKSWEVGFSLKHLLSFLIWCRHDLNGLPFIKCAVILMFPQSWRSSSSHAHLVLTTLSAWRRSSAVKNKKSKSWTRLRWNTSGGEGFINEFSMYFFFPFFWFHESNSLSSYGLLPFRYFEQRLRVAEETYREEITLLQLRLVENSLEESVLKTTDSR